jgi:hypothetical protein
MWVLCVSVMRSANYSFPSYALARGRGVFRLIPRQADVEVNILTPRLLGSAFRPCIIPRRALCPHSYPLGELNMKKILVLSAVLAALIGCQQKQAPAPAAAPAPAPAAAPAPADAPAAAPAPAPAPDKK